MPTVAAGFDAVSRAISNTISVKVLHKETGNGLANLIVELFDIDDWPDPENGRAILAGGPPAAAGNILDLATVYRPADRMGSRPTDASGTCLFQVSP